MASVSQPYSTSEIEVRVPSQGTRTAIAVVVALATAATLLLAHGGRSLPFLEWTGAFLLVAIAFDLRERRIPNLLTFPSLLGALALATYTGGGFLLREALVGAALMFAILLPAFFVRALGAGDVKALMVLGALWGPSTAISSLVWMAGAGAVLALGRVVLEGQLLDMLGRWLTSAKVTIQTRQIHYVRPEPGSAAASGIPFALAMGLGAIAYQLTLSGGGSFSW